MNKIGRNEFCPCGSGKKYKNCCLKNANLPLSMPPKREGQTEEDYYYEIYMIGMNQFKRGDIINAEKTYRFILDGTNGKNYIFLSAVCNDVAYIVTEGNLEKNKGRDEILKSLTEASSLLNRALSIKPDNRLAFRNLCIYLSTVSGIGDNSIIEESLLIDCLSKMANHPFFDEMIQTNEFEMFLQTFGELSLCYIAKGTTVEKFDNIVSILKQRLNRNKAPHLKLLGCLLNYYISTGNSLEIIQITDVFIRMDNTVPDGWLARGNAYMWQMDIIEACKCLRKSIELFNDVKSVKKLSNKNSDKDKIFTAEMNLAACLIELKELEEARIILEKHLETEINNTDLYNYARLYYELGHYEKALEYGKKALFILEDETTYGLLGKIYFSTKDYKSASDMFIKSIALFDCQTLSFADPKYGKTISRRVGTSDLWNKTMESVFCMLLKCLFEENDIASASLYYEMGVNRLPDSNDLSVFGYVMEAYALVREKDEIIEKRNSSVKRLENEKMQAQEQLKRGERDWQKKLIKLQEKLKTVSEENLQWKLLVENNDSIIKKMIEEQKENQSLKSLSKIKTEFTKKYNKLNPNSLNFLSTAEFLFDANKEINIDFAPIMVEYCKVIENELSVYMMTNNYISDKKTALGELLHMIENKQIPKLIDICPDLREIYKHRNGSAHTGISSKGDVEIVRQLLFDFSVLKNLCEIK